MITLNEKLPREKAKELGFSSLSDQELLALVIKSACKDRNVFELSNDIIQMAGGFENLVSLSYEELVSIKGIKDAKAMELLAILEISRRLARIDKISEEQLDHPQKVIDWLRFNMAFSSQEEFMAVYLNTKGVIIKSEILFKGSKNTSVVAVDELLRRALLSRASFILIAHNHPSGDVNPSKADIDLTEKLANASRLIQIPLVDHIIISKNAYFSFKTTGLL